MRDIKILNKNYEVANLYTVVYEGYTIKEIIEDTPVFDVTPPQHYLDYWQKIYDYLKSGTKVAGHTYLPQGQSKYDVAYVNKTIDEPIAELNGHTLREVFEDGKLLVDKNNEFPISLLTYWDNSVDSSISLVDGYIEASITADGLFGAYYSYNLGASKYYYVWEFIPNAKRIGQVRFIDTIYSFEFEINKVNQLTSIQNGSSATNRLYVDVGTGNIVKHQYFQAYDLIALGIDNLTVEQIDYYYSLYKARKDIPKKALTYADIFEGFQSLNNPLFEIDSNDNEYADGFVFSRWREPQIVNGKQYLVGDSTSNPFIYQESVFVSKKGFYYSKKEYRSSYGYSYIQLYDQNTFNNAITMNLGNEFSGERTVSNIQNSDRDIVRFVLATLSSGLNTDYWIEHMIVAPLTVFDESITKEQLDTMLAHYLLVKNIVIYPEIYVPTDPTGFGNRYAFLEINKKVYGHELDFDNMQLNLLFGVYKNAYDSYNQLMNFIINNEGIIAYDYGKGVRYTDIRLIKSPKTELDDGQYLKEKFDFKRLSPFYTLEQGSSLTIKNIHDWPIKPIVSGTVNTNIVYIEAEETTSGLLKAVKFDFTALIKPFNFYYNAETKQILINGLNNGYQYIDFSYGISFLSLPKDTEYIIWTTGVTSPTVKAKKWVID